LKTEIKDNAFMFKNFTFLIVLILMGGLGACTSDPDLDDITTEIVGEYQGDYVDANLLSTGTTVKVSRVSNTRIKISNPDDNLFVSWEATIIMPDDNTITSGTATDYSVSFDLNSAPVSFGFSRNSGETFSGLQQ